MGKYIPRRHGHKVAIFTQSQSWDTGGTFARFNRLLTLKIFVEILMEASDFSEKEYVQNSMGTLPMPPWRENLGKSIACDLFRKFYEHDPYSHLETLEFRLLECFDAGHLEVC